MFVLGFIDAHSHPSGAGVNELVQVNADLRSASDIAAALQERAGSTPAGQWIQAFKYDDTKLSEGRPLNRDDIDALVPDHPVVVAIAVAIPASTTAWRWSGVNRRLRIRPAAGFIATKTSADRMALAEPCRFQ